MTTQEQESVPHPLELRDEILNMPATIEDLGDVQRDTVEDLLMTEAIVALAMIYTIAELLGKNPDDVQGIVQKYLPQSYHGFFKIQWQNLCVCDGCMSAPRYTPGMLHVESCETYRRLIRNQ